MFNRGSDTLFIIVQTSSGLLDGSDGPVSFLLVLEN